MIRFIFVIFIIVIFLVLGIPLMLAEWIIGKINMNFRHKSSKFIVKWVFKFLLFLSGTKVIADGVENVPLDTAVVYVGNHNSFFDILISYTYFARPTGFIAKKELIKAPLLNVWMLYINCLFIDRDNIKEGLKTILKGIEHLKNGISVCIFPEGTRSKDGKMLPFKDGSFKLAEKSGCPIIPMALTNTSNIWEKQFPKLRKTTVTISFGKPIYVKDLPKEERKMLGKITKSHIQELLDRQLED